VITLSNGYVQGPNNVAVASGSVTFTLSQDANVIAAPYGQVAAGVSVRFYFDQTGKLIGSPQIWSNAELNPSGTYYLVNFYDVNGARVNQTPFQWTFSQSAGTTADIGNILP
jgi:hypothetical protein